MQAVILVGGEGTRLRPLTSTVPKPVVPLVDRPFIAFMLEWLRGHGIDDVIMSCGFLADERARRARRRLRRSGIRLRFVEEPEPRGTAGALKLAEPMLDERFLMLNGDVLTDIDLTRADRPARAHRRARRRSRSCRSRTRAPTGSCMLDEDRSVREFVEKPSSDRDRHEPDQRRRVRARARGPRAGAARTATSRSSARCGRGSSATASTAFPRRATGWTSARPSATCRAPSTSSRATSTTAVRERLGDELAGDRRRRRGARAGDPAGGDRARRAASPRARRSAAWSCSATTSRSARAATVERAVILERRRDRRGLQLRDCIVGRRLPGRRAQPDHRRSGARRGRDASGLTT